MRRLCEWKYMNPPTGNNNSSNTAASNNTSKVPSYKEKFKELLAQIDKEKNYTYNVVTLTDNALVFELTLDTARKVTIAIVYKPYTNPPVWKVGVNNLMPLDYKDWNEVLDVFEIPGIIKDVSSLKESLATETEVPTKLYHATYKQFLNSIKKKGLGNTKKKMWSDSISGVVYLADDPWVAESYAEESEYIDSVEDPDDYLDNIIILEVDVSKLDSSKLYIDENVLLDPGEENSTWEYHGIIPWEAIKIFNSSIVEEFKDYDSMWMATPQVSTNDLYIIYCDFDDGSYDILYADSNLDIIKKVFKREAKDFMFPIANADQTINLLHVKLNELSSVDDREFISLVNYYNADEWSDREITIKENKVFSKYEKLFWSDPRFSVLCTFTDVEAYEAAISQELDPENMTEDEWREFIEEYIEFSFK